MRPRLLDLCCHAGGTSMGYHMAGFDVTGVDLEPQPHFPFRFIQWDVLKLRAKDIRAKFDAVAASPPCQAYSITRHVRGDWSHHPTLVEPVRELLDETGLPYIIENVPGAPLENPVRLCGSSFGLRVRRHRLFESNVELWVPPCDHSWQDLHRVYRVGMSKSRGGFKMSGVIPVFGGTQLNASEKGDLYEASVAMGINWMKKSELNQAIPPAYTRFLGRQLIEQL